jgi:hypothetical protein
MRRYREFFIAVILSFISVISVYAQEYRVVRGAVDLHSNISDGLYSLEKIAELAKDKELSVLIFGDSALRKWEYGLWPLRNFIKKTLEENSVLRFGVDKYLKKFTALKKGFPDLVIIPGLEVSPFYYWQGSPLSKNFSLNDWYKKFLVIGLKDKEYKNLPIVGNRGFGYISFSRFSQYQGQRGIRPYQDLIDYVNEKKGLIFWAHPEMESLEWYKGIQVYSPAHPEDLFLSQDYAGFGITFTDKLKMTEPGDIWDKLLLEYIQGKRKKPAWIIGSLHYDGPSRRINDVETMFFVRDIKQEDILDALRQGRMYVRFNLGSNSLVLREFSVKNLSPDSVQINIKGNNPSLEPIKIELISNGKIFKSFEEAKKEWVIVVEDNLSAKSEKRYYRLKISSSSSLILSNPVFAE